MNFLLIQANQLPCLVLGAYGNKAVRTPYLDGLAAQGIVFDHAFAPPRSAHPPAPR
ncbi:MAG: hypothetical protein ACUVWX_14175 [Kiritimatiellia bacterium]